MRTIDLESLRTALAGERPPLLIDVLTADSYAAEHIPGASNACVYRVDFVENVRELAKGELGSSIVLYGLSAEWAEAGWAATKLERAGFDAVQVFKGGLESWRAAGLEFNGEGFDSASRPPSCRLALDPERCSIRWTGRNQAKQHDGTLDLASGWVEISDGRPTAGELVIEATSIRCRDIENPKWNQVLIDHILNDDFLDADRFPTISFEVEGSTALESAAPGRPNVRIEGQLELLGQKLPLPWEAAVAEAGDRRWAAQGHLCFDRAQWGMIYGSASSLARIGMHLVNDLIDLDLCLVTEAPGED